MKELITRLYGDGIADYSAISSGIRKGIATLAVAAAPFLLPSGAAAQSTQEELNNLGWMETTVGQNLLECQCTNNPVKPAWVQEQIEHLDIVYRHLWPRHREGHPPNARPPGEPIPHTHYKDPNPFRINPYADVNGYVREAVGKLRSWGGTTRDTMPPDLRSEAAGVKARLRQLYPEYCSPNNGCYPEAPGFNSAPGFAPPSPDMSYGTVRNDPPPQEQPWQEEVLQEQLRPAEVPPRRQVAYPVRETIDHPDAEFVDPYSGMVNFYWKGKSYISGELEFLRREGVIDKFKERSPGKNEGEAIDYNVTIGERSFPIRFTMHSRMTKTGGIHVIANLPEDTQDGLTSRLDNLLNRPAKQASRNPDKAEMLDNESAQELLLNYFRDNVVGSSAGSSSGLLKMVGGRRVRVAYTSNAREVYTCEIAGDSRRGSTIWKNGVGFNDAIFVSPAFYRDPCVYATDGYAAYIVYYGADSKKLGFPGETFYLIANNINPSEHLKWAIEDMQKKSR
ncbi:MAG: hypothetical protein HY518_05255 [Candidatus Aenigmarchaeota archaeon]|nr:hypothetical protein [Candidatus Aenigmarchaeota archaeon]